MTFEFGDDFLNNGIKSTIHETKIDKLDFVQIKHFYSVKHTTKRMYTG